ncbi:hypothetical protein [Salipaludibacillus neizhouensis]|nr:hypothetical protein [Salipaludibacillus neizhouensis]
MLHLHAWMAAVVAGFYEVIGAVKENSKTAMREEYTHGSFIMV